MTPLEFDVTDLLRPGVYLLRQRGRVVYVARAKCLLASLAVHKAIISDRVRAWFLVPAVQFDGMSIIPCGPDRAVELLPALIALHNPIHNRAPGPPPSTTPIHRRNFTAPSCPPQ